MDYVAYGRYFQGALDNWALLAECRIAWAVCSRNKWLTEMGFCPIDVAPAAMETGVSSSLELFIEAAHTARATSGHNDNGETKRGRLTVPDG